MKKVYDRKGRHRNVVTSFRMSRTESDLLNTMVRLSGLTKQDYILKRCFEKDIVIVGSPRIFKALHSEMKKVFAELKRVTSNKPLDDELLDRIHMVAVIMEGMNK